MASQDTPDPIDTAGTMPSSLTDDNDTNDTGRTASASDHVNANDTTKYAATAGNSTGESAAPSSTNAIPVISFIDGEPTKAIMPTIASVRKPIDKELDDFFSAQPEGKNTQAHAPTSRSGRGERTNVMTAFESIYTNPLKPADRRRAQRQDEVRKARKEQLQKIREQPQHLLKAWNGDWDANANDAGRVVEREERRKQALARQYSYLKFDEIFKDASLSPGACSRTNMASIQQEVFQPQGTMKALIQQEVLRLQDKSKTPDQQEVLRLQDKSKAPDQQGVPRPQDATMDNADVDYQGQARSDRTSDRLRATYDEMIDVGDDQDVIMAGTEESQSSMTSLLDWRQADKRTIADLAEQQVFKVIPTLMAKYGIQSTGKSVKHLAADVSAEVESQRVNILNGNKPELFLVRGETLVATRMLRQYLGKDHNYVVHNFASASMPGGEMLTGSTAQEESLCWQSDLRSLLVNKGLYRIEEGETISTTNVNILFTGGHRPLSKERCFTVGVITFPAPIFNGSIASYNRSTGRERMRDNIHHLFNQAQHMGATVLVVGAWGCGAHNHPSAEVAQMFREELENKDWTNTSISYIVFAIKDRKPGKPVLNDFRNAFYELDSQKAGFRGVRIDEKGSILTKLWFGALGNIA